MTSKSHPAELAEPALGKAAAALTVTAVARRLGVAPDTLRTWDRRYGLGPSERAHGHRRRYTQSDLAKLELMRRLVHSGVAAGEAARIACDGLPPTEVSGILARTEAAALVHQDELALPTDISRGLARAVLALDSFGCQRLISAQLAASGAVTTWNNLLRPVLASLGRRWQTTTRGIEHEHLLVDAATAAFNIYIAQTLTAPRARPVLLAGAPDELHTLPLVATAAALAEQQIDCRFLGPRVPYSALSASIQRVGPAAVLVWAQTSENGDPSGLAALPQLRPAVKVLLAGPGWPAVLPQGTERIDCIVDAVNRISAVVE